MKKYKELKELWDWLDFCAWVGNWKKANETSNKIDEIAKVIKLLISLPVYFIHFRCAIMYDKDELKNSLTIEQIFDLVTDLGGEPIMKDGYFVSRTICHNPPGTGSYKLYYYDNTKLFKCFTECSDTFDVYELVCKINNLRNDDNSYQLFKAILYILKYFNIANENFDFSDQQELLGDWNILNKYDENNSIRLQQIVDLKVYDESILKNLPHPIIEPWEAEGIDRNVMSRHKIAYDPAAQGIVIPHYDMSGNLIGIRERTLVQELEIYGKYRPAILNGKMYNHPLSFNLYNLNNSKDNIKALKKAIIGEGEKFCMMYASYFGLDNDISVACCGSALIWYQVQLLLSLDVEEIIVAFDKQFKEIGDDEFKRWVKKLTDIYNKYNKYVTVSFLFDKWNLLGYKDSPIDKGKDIFLELCNRRIYL